jgi:hypothetical protein
MTRWTAWLLPALLAPGAWAQQRVPHAAFVYPAGGRQGTTFEAIVGGQFLDGADSTIFAGAGVSAEVTGFARPVPPKELEALRNQLREVQQSRANPQLAAGLRQQIARDQRLRSTPALSEAVSLRITIAPGAAPGNHELRLIANNGLTNPLVFLVNQLPGSVRPARFVPLKVAAGGGLPLNAQAHADPSPPPETVELPVILNGQMMPGAVDRYRFHARKGQQIVVAALTRTLLPYRADAVPGWFQAALTLTGPDGKELAAADHFRFSQEPVIAQEIPADGDYLLAVRDILDRGREDFVYRITIGEVPYVTGIFPLGGRPGQHPRIELNGWNAARLQVRPSWREQGVHYFTAGMGGWTANAVPFRVDTLPETVAKNPGATAARAQRVKLPIVIDGRIAQPGAVHCFRFDAKSGEEIVAEVEARRLGSPLDSTLTLTDAKGRRLAFNDDADDKEAALLTHQADSRIRYRFRAKGTYFLRLADSQQDGGPDFAYRLRISNPRPDFEVRMAPSSINLRPGRTVPVVVMLLRRDGFQGAVKLRVKEGPRDLLLSGGEIPAGVDSVRVGLTAPAEAIAAPQHLTIEAEASIDGQTVRHDAGPADDNIQAFAWHETVPAQDGLVWTVGKERRKPLWSLAGGRLVLPVGGSALLRLAVPPGMARNRITLALSDPPAGISIADVSQDGSILQIRFRADSKVAPGLAGNLIVEASVIREAAGTPARTARPVPLDTLPAIPFEAVGR